MGRRVLLVVSAVVVLCTSSPVRANTAQSWDVHNDWSTATNPNGVWSYGRKWTAGGTSFDLLTVRWDDTGWYLGNGNPSIQGRVLMWAWDNSNGYPVVRWTCPQSGSYSLDGVFTGADSRGVDSFVYVAVDGEIRFSDRVTSNGDTAPFTLGNMGLQQGSVIDFVSAWGGGVDRGYSWTRVGATITAVPEPSSLPALGGALGCLIPLLRRRR